MYTQWLILIFHETEWLLEASFGSRRPQHASAPSYLPGPVALALSSARDGCVSRILGLGHAASVQIQSSREHDRGSHTVVVARRWMVQWVHLSVWTGGAARTGHRWANTEHTPHACDSQRQRQKRLRTIDHASNWARSTMLYAVGTHCNNDTARYCAMVG